jgi:secondary thiamine-phosphate synthase enzyme
MNVITITSRQRVELIDITTQVSQAIRASGVNNGLATIFTPHTTAAITINENADPDVPRDLIMELNKIVPFEDGYAHGEGNSAAHLKSSLIGVSETIIIVDGAPLLGTWQGLYFCEFDGPRQRKVHIKVIAG